MPTARTALITGVAGQDGSYLAEQLISDGYRVAGVVRHRAASLERIAHVAGQIELIEVDLLDVQAIRVALGRIRPDEVYNLAGDSFVPGAMDQADPRTGVTGLAAGRILDAIAMVDPGIRFYQASSSEIFGNAPGCPQDERTSLNPRNPYGEAKAIAHLATLDARERRGLFATAGILYNHESPRRGLDFISRRVTHAVARIHLGLADSLALGRLEAIRDWGFAGDYARAIRLIMRQDQPDEFVIATGIPHSVRELCEIAFRRAGLDPDERITLDPSLVRPPEQVQLVGDPSKAHKILGWRPSIDFESLIAWMVDMDVATLQRGPASTTILPLVTSPMLAEAHAD